MNIELTESWLSNETGISRDTLRDAREKNLSAAEWRKGTRGQIVWEIDGLDRCSAVFPEFAGIIEKIKGGAEGAEKALGGLTVVKLTMSRKFANPRLIEALDEQGTKILVRVRDSKNFAKGMRVMARPSKMKDQPWLFEGRAPRWLGRY